MHVIHVTSNRGANAFCFLHMMGEQVKHLVTKCRIVKKRSSLLGGKNDVQPNLSERLGHNGYSSTIHENGRAFGPRFNIVPSTQPVGLG